jgi:hypothetical protein
LLPVAEFSVAGQGQGVVCLTGAGQSVVLNVIFWKTLWIHEHGLPAFCRSTSVRPDNSMRRTVGPRSDIAWATGPQWMRTIVQVAVKNAVMVPAASRIDNVTLADNRRVLLLDDYSLQLKLSSD